MLPVPAGVYQALGAAPPIRTRGTFDANPFELAVLSDGTGGGKLLLAKAMLKALHKRIGDELKVELQYDNSPYGMSLPPELAELFQDAPELKHAFDTQYTPGKQRGLLHYIKSAKTEATRTKRILELVRRLGVDPF